jgi:hypothetical protein
VSDRREQPRFEIVGRLRGSVATAEPVSVVNIGAGGALVETRRAVPVQSIVTLRMRSGAAEHDVRFRVCHVRPTWEHGEAYLLGLEFLTGDSAPHEQPGH